MSGETPKVCIVTFGCQMNKLDSQLLRGELRREGFELEEEPGRADVVLYNTCSVREHAENRVFSHLGTHRRRASAGERFVLGVIGCMAQRLGVEIVRRFDFVDLVCGTRAFLRVPGHLRHILAGGGTVVDVEDESPVRFERQGAMRCGAHQAYVSVMRGCDNFCSYCIVPYVRGREVSRPAAEVVDEVRRLVDGGVREVTLLGQNVNSYRRDGHRLADLLGVVNEVDGLWRVRFVTSHPVDMSDDVLWAVAELEKVCEHLHVPAQAGSDRVLRRMRRRYSRAEYLSMVERAREIAPGVALAGDFIVGFPGEAARDFEQTLSLLSRVRYQQAFIFKYSPRPGTRAARWPDDVPQGLKSERHQRLLAAQKAIDEERRRAMIGREVDVLVEGVSKQDESRLCGRTRGNDIVVFPGDAALSGTLQRVRITDATTLTLFGEVSNPGAGP